MNNLDLFFYCFTKGDDALKEIVVQVLTDNIITHPQLLAPPMPDADATDEDVKPRVNPRIKPVTKVMIKAFNSDNKSISLTACTAVSKLLLLGILPPEATAELLKAFVLTYFDPETTEAALRQALSYFLPVFCHSKLKNAQLMAHITVPVVSKLLLMREETLDEEVDEMVGWPVITAHLSEWTDGRKVVGATELGLDGKINTSPEAEGPHIYLATEILERALTSTCSKDERKPLLSLLSKLYIPPSPPSSKPGEQRDDETLQTLHGLVAEAVEGKIGTDATQRNALAKLEAGLTKRLGEVEQGAQAQDADDADDAEDAGTPETEAAAADVPERIKRSVSVSEVEADEDDDDDTMLAGMQGEGTRMPLEDDGDEDDDMSEVDEEMAREAARKRKERTGVTEEDIMEELLASDSE
jgi:condensin complex subunit 3